MSAPVRREAPPAPRVSIGTLEIVITAPEGQDMPAEFEAPSSRAGESLASRFYLRSF